MVRLRAILVLLMFCLAVSRATPTSWSVSEPTFRTVTLALNGNKLVPAVALLGSDDTVTLEFDELSDSRRYLRARLVHCNADMTRSGLTDSEISDRFNEFIIDEAYYSQATLTPYVHYRLPLSMAETGLKVSGNYQIEVYDENCPDKVLLQTGFKVTEGAASVSADITTQTDLGYNDGYQQLIVSVDCTRAPVDNINRDLRITVMQNGRPDNMVTLDTPPLRTEGRKAIYEHQRNMIFNAGNEYRRFETVNTSYPGMHVDDIGYAEPYYHFALTTDGKRCEKDYRYDSTQRGRFTVYADESAEPDTEAEYVAVHFTLDIPEMPGRRIYIDGDLTGRRLDPDAMMVFNREKRVYEKTLLLKQGSYNYQYLSITDGNGSHTAEIEGDFRQTSNEYGIAVYTRKFGERYDRLIGFTVVDSEIK